MSDTSHIQTNDRPDVREFTARLNQPFRLRLGDGGTLALELIQVDDRGARRVGETERHSFSLLFRSPGEKRYAPQAVYRVEHETLGGLDIFLVPVGPDTEGMLYEAVFN